MFRQNESRPTSSKSQSGSSFRQLTEQAKLRFGVAEERPQDLDASMLRFIRRTNLEVIQPFPTDYHQSLLMWANQIPPLEIPSLPAFRDHQVILQNAENQDWDVIKSIKPTNDKFVVLAVDAEFHQEFSYDGFICVASVSSPEKTFIVDTLLQNRAFATNWLSKMLTGKRTLKVVCGGDNDIFRFQKDWACFAVGVVDIQDMFCVWRNQNPEDCFRVCLQPIRKRLVEKKKGSTDVACRQQMNTINNPGLEFLMEVFFLSDNVTKDKSATMADWRKRPLHPTLIQYSAIDSFYTLKVFWELYKRIGRSGLKEAAIMSIRKLTNRGKLPRYKDGIIDTSEGQWLVERILAWRQYLALRLDYKPQQILLTSRVPLLARALKELSSTSDIPAVAKLLEHFLVPLMFHPAAKLLCAYLEESGASLAKMKDTRCHHCNGLGHSANFCYENNNPELKRAFRAREEQRGKNAAQYERRRLHYCEKRGLDPVTTTCFWEDEPHVSKK